MDNQQLVRMANQIAQFFEAWPDEAQAAEEVVQHLQRFWTPAMRSRLSAHVAQGDAAVRPLVTKAVAQLGFDC